VSPMRFAPIRGEMPERAPLIPERRAEYESFQEESLWRLGARLAVAFWETEAGDVRISSGFRRIAREQRAFVEQSGIA